MSYIEDFGLSRQVLEHLNDVGTAYASNDWRICFRSCLGEGQLQFVGGCYYEILHDAAKGPLPMNWNEPLAIVPTVAVMRHSVHSAEPVRVVPPALSRMAMV